MTAKVTAFVMDLTIPWLVGENHTLKVMETDLDTCIAVIQDPSLNTPSMDLRRSIVILMALLEAFMEGGLHLLYPCASYFLDVHYCYCCANFLGYFITQHLRSFSLATLLFVAASYLQMDQLP